ncbi:MAG TPA: hypothetical protein DEF51_09040 [Myxococcales bacterium]|nr:hypothetical protein [Myxococcales bacterium]
MKPHRSLAFLFVALLAIGCDPIPGEDAGMNEDADVQLPGDAEPRGDADVRVEPRLALGTGEGRFNTFEDGQTLDLVSGCQGAQHVWVALRAWGIDRRGPIIDVELIRDSDGERVSQVFRVRVSFDDVGQEYVDVFGLTLVVPEPDTSIGEDLTLRATVTDRNETVISDERPIRIEWGPGGCG